MPTIILVLLLLGFVIYLFQTLLPVIAVALIIGVPIFLVCNNLKSQTPDTDCSPHTKRTDSPPAQTPLRTVAEANAYARKIGENVCKSSPDITKGYQWLAALDGNTCFFCANLDGKKWDLHDRPVDGNPYQKPRQACPNCRCTWSPVLKSWEELGIEGFGDLDEGTRASMDGQVPGDWDFEEWFKHQQPDFQMRYLGASRYKLWSNSKIVFRDLVTKDGRVRSLAEMGYPAMPEDAPATAYYGYPKTKKLTEAKVFLPVENVGFSKVPTPDWNLALSFGQSRSPNLDRALAVARSADTFLESEYNGKKAYQAIFSAKRKSFLKYLKLYEIVGNWKSAAVFVNGNAIDRKIIGRVNYCYGDCCRSGDKSFCYGASFMTKNPFGCHRLQISAHNNPWYSFYKRADNNTFRLDRESMKNQIDNYALIYCICPVFSYEQILKVFYAFPDVIGEGDYHSYCNEGVVILPNIKQLQDYSELEFIMK